MLIDKDKLEQAKRAIANETPDLIADLLNLQQYDSRNHKALCPVHSEDTPSFVWNPKALNFHCFGCSHNVDIVDAYMESGLTFNEACEQIFEKAGIAYTFGEKGVRTKSQYRYPKEEPITEKETITAYFKKRCISRDVLDYCDVREDKGGNAVFNYYDTNDVLTMVKYKPSHKIDKTKKENKSWCQKGADTTPLLFNMNRVNPEQPLLITEGECFKGDVQLLTPQGWIRLDEYDNQDVLQVNDDLTAQFVKPLAYIQREYNGRMFDITKGGRFSLTTTINHNWVYKNCDGDLKKIKPSALPKYFYYGNIPTSVNYSSDKFTLGKDMIALWIAISADGTIDERKNALCNYCRISLKKQRKIDRFVSLLESMNIQYTTSVNNREEHFFGFNIPKYITKELPIEFATCTSVEQKKFIIDELAHWDGNYVPNRNQIEYSTTLIHNAEIVQTIAHLCGYRSTIMHRTSKSKDKTKDYSWLKVSILFGGSRDVAFNNVGISYSDYDGKVYCVSVPSGMILVRQNEHISVCGNCDCLAAIESGYKNSVSVPLGANNYGWIEQNWEFLEQFNSIILAFDNDEAGVKAQKEVIYRLGTWRTGVVDIPATVEFNDRSVTVKDINELLYYKGKEAVLDAIVNAKDSPVQSVVDFSTIEDVDIDKMPGIYTGFKEVDKVIGKIFYSMITIVSGLPSSGKSSFLNQIIGNVIDSGERVWIFSNEMNSNILSNWLTLGLAGRGNINEYISTYTGAPYYKTPPEIKEKIRRFYDGQLYIYKDDAPNDEDSLFVSMEECVRKFGIRTLIIDNLMCIALNNASNDKYDAQTVFFNRLIKFAKKFNVAIIIVCHPKKLPAGVREVDMYDISGSSNIINLAHLSFALRRISKKEKEDPKCPYNRHDVLLSIIKDRVQGRNGVEIPFYYDVPSRRFYTNYEEYTRNFKWDSEKANANIEIPEKLKDYAMEIYGDKKDEQKRNV